MHFDPILRPKNPVLPWEPWAYYRSWRRWHCRRWKEPWTSGGRETQSPCQSYWTVIKGINRWQCGSNWIFIKWSIQFSCSWTKKCLLSICIFLCPVLFAIKIHMLSNTNISNFSNCTCVLVLHNYILPVPVGHEKLHAVHAGGHTLSSSWPFFFTSIFASFFGSSSG